MLARVLTAAVGIPLMVYVACVDSVWPLRIFCVALFVAVLVESFCGAKQGTKVARVLTPIAFLIWCFGILAILFMGEGSYRNSTSAISFHTGPLLLTLLTIWAGDTAGMLVGRKFGKHKLAPRISPQKTWEGSIANFFAALSCGWALASLGSYPHTTGLWLGCISGFCGQYGDLLESAWKRECGIKDSGNLLPGHGGVLDRFDSLLFTSIMLGILMPIL